LHLSGWNNMSYPFSYFAADARSSCNFFVFSLLCIVLYIHKSAVFDGFTEVIYIHKEQNRTQSCSLRNVRCYVNFFDCTPSIMTVCVQDVRKPSIHFKVFYSMP
jgi:hypothetical protein